MVTKNIKDLIILVWHSNLLKSGNTNCWTLFIFVFYIRISLFQEPYMEVVNPFILKNKERMIVFLDQLSSVTDPNPLPGQYIEASNSHLCSDAGGCSLTFCSHIANTIITYILGRELATLHHICVSYLPDLQVLAKTNISIKKLVTVTDMLTKHKLKYREMIS